MKVIIQIDKEEPIEFGFKVDAVEYLENIRASGRYYYKIYTKEGRLETIFLKHLSSICEDIMKFAATMEGVLIDAKLGKDGEMTLSQKICTKLELEGLIEENELKDGFLVHRLTKKGLLFYNDYKALAWMRKKYKVKVKHDPYGLREKLGIYNIR
jgi:predicted transcriptional regulator